MCYTYARKVSRFVRKFFLIHGYVYPCFIYIHIYMILYIHKHLYLRTYMFKYDRATLMRWWQIITQVSTNYTYRHAYIYTYLELLTFLSIHMNERLSGGTYSSKDDVGYFVDRMIYKKRMLAAASSTTTASASVAASESK